MIQSTRRLCTILSFRGSDFLIALARQCLQERRYALVVSRETKMGASPKSVRKVQHDPVNVYPQLSSRVPDIVVALIFLNSKRYLTFVILAKVIVRMWQTVWRCHDLRRQHVAFRSGSIASMRLPALNMRFRYDAIPPSQEKLM